MAMGARKAFEELRDAGRDRWLSLPFLGCDGLPKTGQAWVNRGLLTATVFSPPNAGQAVEMLAKVVHSNSTPPERTLTAPLSVPTLAKLASMQAEKLRALSAHGA